MTEDALLRANIRQEIKRWPCVCPPRDYGRGSKAAERVDCSASFGPQLPEPTKGQSCDATEGWGRGRDAQRSIAMHESLRHARGYRHDVPAEPGRYPTGIPGSRPCPPPGLSDGMRA